MPIRTFLLANLVLFLNVLSAQSSWQPDWQASLGSYAPQGIYRLTVCPSGQSYFTDSFGRVTSLSPTGKVDFDQSSLPEFQNTVVYSCDSHGHLHAVNAKQWAVWKLDAAVQPPTLQKLRSKDISGLSLVPRQLVVSPSGDAFLFALEAKDNRAAKLLHFNADLSLLQARVLTTTEDPAVRQLLSHGQLLYLPSGHLAFFTRHNLHSNRINPDLSLTAPINLEPTSLELISSAVLPNGEIYTQSIQPAQLSKSKSKFLLSRINPANPSSIDSFPLPSGVKGILQGADANGKLYFLSVSPRTGANIYRYTLNP
ncbi:MAG: hypothetical protein NW208_06260 [Bryobacter sp.]|nr:hypothetical protein [Bryobacter sp.]